MKQVEAKRSSFLITDGVEVAGLIRQAILNGDLISGQRLVEADLAESLNASRGAIRAGLNTLLAEELIEKPRNYSARVRHFKLEEALEIIQLRALIESECAAQAARVGKTEDIAELQRLGRKMRKSVQESDNDEYSRLNRALHTKIIQTSGYSVSGEIVKRLRVQQAKFSIQLSKQAGRPRESIEEHLRVIDMIAMKDSNAARQAMYDHLMSVKTATENYFQNRNGI